MKIKFVCLLLLICWLSSCSKGTLNVSSVGYQSIRTKVEKSSDVPNNAEILAVYSINDNGGVSVVLFNRTSEIMIVDKTMSFFVNSNGASVSYYDPTINTTTRTDISSGTTGASVNLGAIAGAAGIGGALGEILGGVNVGGSSTQGQSVSNTTYQIDQPRVSIGPRSSICLDKVYNVIGIGESGMGPHAQTNLSFTPNNSSCKFSVCVSYSLDGGNKFKKIVTDMYLSSQIIMPVSQKGKVNEALRNVYSAKTDALTEPWWMIHFSNNLPAEANGVYDSYVYGSLFDYQ